MEETGQVKGRCAHAGVGAAVGEDLGFPRAEGPVLFHAGPYIVEHGGPALRGDEILFPREDNLDRPEELHGEHGTAEDRPVELELAAETAAHIVRDDAYIAFSHAEHAGHEPLHVIGGLGGMVDSELSVRGVAGHRRAGLHTHMGLAAALEPVFPDILCFLKGLLHIAPLDMPGNIDIPLKAFMDFRCLFLNCIERLVNRRKHFIFNIDQVKGLFCDLFGHCRHCRNRLADVADLVDGEYLLIAEILVAPPDTLLDPEGVLACHNTYDAGKLQGFAVINVHDLRMRMGASQDLAVEHAGQLHVEGVGCPARHLCNAVYIVNVAY